MTYPVYQIRSVPFSTGRQQNWSLHPRKYAQWLMAVFCHSWCKWHIIANSYHITRYYFNLRLQLSINQSFQKCQPRPMLGVLGSNHCSEELNWKNFERNLDSFGSCLLLTTVIHCLHIFGASLGFHKQCNETGEWVCLSAYRYNVSVRQ